MYPEQTRYDGCNREECDSGDLDHMQMTSIGWQHYKDSYLKLERQRTLLNQIILALKKKIGCSLVQAKEILWARSSKLQSSKRIDKNLIPDLMTDTADDSQSLCPLLLKADSLTPNCRSTKKQILKQITKQSCFKSTNMQHCKFEFSYTRYW